jgi:hypothetical protein
MRFGRGAKGVVEWAKYGWEGILALEYAKW